VLLCLGGLLVNLLGWSYCGLRVIISGSSTIQKFCGRIDECSYGKGKFRVFSDYRLGYYLIKAYCIPSFLCMIMNVLLLANGHGRNESV